MCVQQADTVYLVNMCKEYLSRARGEELAEEEKKSTWYKNVAAEIFPAEILESISNNIVKIFLMRIIFNLLLTFCDPILS